MQRYALLIEASNVTGEEDLPGARNDVIAMRNFLMSPPGGAWRHDEIEIVNKPQYRSVFEKLLDHKEDYSLVYFSGHGSECVQGCPSVCLNDTEMTIPVTCLYPKSKYGIVITDCCRGNGMVETLNENMKKASFSFEEAFDATDVTSRNLWDAALSQCIRSNTDDGIVEMLACQYNEAASEIEAPEAYGLYTHAIINAAKNWYQEASCDTFLTTLQVHEKIKLYMALHGQHPAYFPSELEYPFAIKA